MISQEEKLQAITKYFMRVGPELTDNMSWCKTCRKLSDVLMALNVSTTATSAERTRNADILIDIITHFEKEHREK